MPQMPVARRNFDPLPSRQSVSYLGAESAKPPRLVSLDAYRGLIMIVLASGGFALHSVARSEKFADEHAWQVLAFQTDHVEWVGGTLASLFRHDKASEKANELGDWFGGGAWDLIQPSFMFMVGVALPFSYASRRARGDSMFRIWLHVFVRAFLLVALGIFLRSTSKDQTYFTFEDVLTQIGLGYPFVFLVFLLGQRSGSRGLVYLVAIAAILLGYWGYFAYSPLPGSDFDYSSVGLAAGPWPWTEGFFAHWNKNTNAAQWFDLWFLNLFPRTSPWKYNGGGYLTLNFVPSMATALFGVLAGEMLREQGSKWLKLLALLALAAVCLGVGAVAGEKVCPIVKRIWTPSFAVYSAGWTFLMLAAFYAVVDCIGFRWWTFPLVVVGMNSIAMYCMESLLRGWFGKMLQVHLRTPMRSLIEWINSRWSEGARLPTGDYWYSFAGDYGPIVQSATVLLVMWLICLWMYRRKIFLRV